MGKKKTKGLLKKAIAVVLGITMAYGALALPQGNAKNSFTTASAYDTVFGGCIFSYEIIEDRNVKTARITDIGDHGESVTVPSTITHNGQEYPVESVSSYFLKNDQTIKTIIFSEGIKRLETDLLSGTSVENIIIPDSVEYIGDYFASECSNLKSVEYSGKNIKRENMGTDIFLYSNTSGIINEKGAICLGNWLIKYTPDESVTSVRLTDLGNDGCKIENIAENAFPSNPRLTSVDLKGIKAINENNFSNMPQLVTVKNSENVETVGFDCFDRSPWYEKSKKGDLVKIGKTILYYKTDAKILDFTGGDLKGIKKVCSKALIDCRNAETILCSSDCDFEPKCFYEANEVYFKDQLPERPGYKIKNIFLDGKQLSIYNILDDPTIHEWIVRNITNIDNSEFTKELFEQKTKLIFEQMDIPYYGPGNDKIGTLTPTEEFYIRLKVLSYISMYDYDHNAKYHTSTGGLLLGGKFTCEDYAMISHYFLECAGVRAKTFYTDPKDTKGGVHYWNATKLGDEWFLCDDGWCAQTDHNYGNFLLSYSKFNYSIYHEMQISYDSYHFYPLSTEEITADRTLGDIDGDNDRDKDDAAILWAFVKDETGSIPDKRADINLDGEIDVTDAVLLDNMVNRQALDADNVPIDGFAPGFRIAFLNGEDYDNIQYIFTDREGYITLPDDLFEAPEGKKISYDVGKAGQKVRLTTPLQVVKVKWIDENEPDYSEPDSSKPDSSSSSESSKPDSSMPDSSDDSSKPDDTGTLGDVNGDRTIDIEDAVCIIQHINGLTPLKADEEKRADVSKDGNIDIGDAVILISYINGNSTF